MDEGMEYNYTPRGARQIALTAGAREVLLCEFTNDWLLNAQTLSPAQIYTILEPGIPVRT